MSDERPPTDGCGGATDGDGPGASVQSSVPADRSMSAGEVDALFELLANERRRHLLAYLAGADDGVATYSELVDHVADAEGVTERGVSISVHHAHLPKLADYGVVEYDDRSETVRYRGDPAVADWLEFVRA